uniref:Uncharacterized protein n=1 Tax=Magallana gigas TaxID=29159 RepID=K1P859_MAGGI
MKTSLAIVLVLSLLGLSNVSAQNSNSNILGSLLVGGLAGWGINNVIQRNRRQDAINDAILARVDDKTKGLHFPSTSKPIKSWKKFRF